MKVYTIKKDLYVDYRAPLLYLASAYTNNTTRDSEDLHNKKYLYVDYPVPFFYLASPGMYPVTSLVVSSHKWISNIQLWYFLMC